MRNANQIAPRNVTAAEVEAAYSAFKTASPEDADRLHAEYKELSRLYMLPTKAGSKGVRPGYARR